MDNIYVSVIVPVYNVEEYLEECIESLINQKLENIEIILINDGSIDKSGDILNEYAKRDGRIKVIEQKNSGLAMTRNRGVEESRGEYLMFIDSDDYIDSDMIYKMYSKAKKYNCPLIITDLELFWENGKKSRLNNFICNETKRYDSSELTKMLLNSEMYCQVVNKIYKRDIWLKNEIKFEGGRYYEDIVPSFKIVDIYKEAMFINDAMYKYRMRMGSIVANPSIKKIKDYLQAIEEVVIFVNGRYLIQFERNIKTFRIAYGLEALNMVSKINISKDENINYQKNINYGLCETLMNGSLSIKNKWKFILYKFKIYLIAKKLVKYVKRKG